MLKMDDGEKSNMKIKQRVKDTTMHQNRQNKKPRNENTVYPKSGSESTKATPNTNTSSRKGEKKLSKQKDHKFIVKLDSNWDKKFINPIVITVKRIKR